MIPGILEARGGNYSTWVSNSTNCGDFVQMTSPNSVGNWRHVVFTLDDVADTRKMYVDGVLVATGSYTSTIPYDGNPVLIGAAIENGNLDFPFHGSLDDVMIFNRAITASEVNTLFTQGSPLQALNARYYADADGDGFGNPTVSQLACSQPSGYVLNNTDCNDNSAAVYPGATEVCDGIDNDCDGNIDAIVTSGIVCGMATSEGQSFTLTAPPGKVFTSVDFASYGTPDGTCGNFTLGSCHATSTMGIVQGLVIGQNSVTLTQNYQIFGDPCVGVYKRFYVQARYSEVIPLTQTYYADADGDGFGNPAISQVACSQPSGYVLNNTDCNDISAAAYPGATEVCDGVDNDCDGNIDAIVTPVVVCGTANEGGSVTLTAPAGRVFTAVNFASYGTPNGACNNFTIGSCHASNSLSIVQGMIIGQNSVSIPASNGLFGDPCPGTVKRLYIQATYGEVVPLAQTYYADADGDGFGNPTVTTTVNCSSTAPAGYVSDNTDCNDANANIYPGVQAGTVSGTANLCIGATTTYTSSGQAGGTWSSANEDIATVDPVTGLVTAISAGTTSIIYTINTCSGPQSASQTININSTPVVNPVSNQMVDHGSSVTAINFSGTATSYTWVNDNPSIGLAASGTGNIGAFTAVNTGVTAATATITVTPVNTNNGLSCTGTAISFTITVAPPAISMNPVPNQVVCAQTLTSPVVFSSSTPGVTYSWTNSEPSISLAASGTGDIPSFLVQNGSNVAKIALITVTPSISDGNGGSIYGAQVTFTIKVNPMPTVIPVNNMFSCHQSTTDPIVFSGNATSFTWTNTNEFIGIPSSGSGNGIPSFTANNISFTTPAVGSIRVIPVINDGVLCQGSSTTFTITVNPKPFMNNVSNRNVCNDNTLTVSFSGIALNRFEWVDNGNILGLPQAGIGNIAATVYNLSNAPYTSNITVTPQFVNGITCSGEPKNFTVTVNPTPDLDAVSNQRLCVGQPTADINFTSNVVGASVTWTNDEPNIGLPASGSGNIPSFIPTGNGIAHMVARSSANGCLGGIRNFSIIVDPIPQINPINDTIVCNNSVINAIFMPSLYTWTNSNPAIGLPASGTSPILGFIATNTTNAPISGTITLTPYNNFCSGTPISFTITVNPTASINPIQHQYVCDGSASSAISLSGTAPDITYSWTNNNTSIGLAASGTGDIPSFTPPFITYLTDVEANIFVSGQVTQNGITCPVSSRSFTITVNALPQYNNALPDLFHCNGTDASISFIQSNSIPTVLMWTNSNPSIGIPASGTGNIPYYTATNNGTAAAVSTFTLTPRRYLPNSAFCDGASRSFTITVLPIPSVNNVQNQEVCPGTTIQEIVFSGHVPGTIYEWVNSDPSIGLPASGTGNILSFVATNSSYVNKTGLIIVRPKLFLQTVYGQPQYCEGQAMIFQITVKGNPRPPVVTANGPTSFCPGQNVTLLSDYPGIWNSNQTYGYSILVNTSGTYFVTNEGDGCGAAVSNSIVVTVLNTVTPTVTLTASANPVCASTPITFTASHSNISGVLSYFWEVGNTSVATTSNTYTVSNPVNGDLVRCKLFSNAYCSASGLSNVIQIRILGPANAGTINGLSTVAAGYNYPYTSNGNAGGVWSSSNPAVLTIDPSTGISTTLSPGVTSITYTLVTGCSAPRSTSKQVEVVDVTSPIVGSDFVCPQTTTISYSLAPTIPSGGSWSISNTTLATITAQAGTDRIISFRPLQTGTVTLSYTLPGNIVIDKIIQIMNAPSLGPITGPRNLCEFYGSNLTFTYTRDLTNPVTGYQWSVPSCLSIISGQGTNTLEVRIGSGYSTQNSYEISATPIGVSCPASVAYMALLSGTPVTPSPIQASGTELCSVIGTTTPITFTIPKVTGASSYIWSAQAGTTTITHPNGLGKNDTIVTVTFSSGFTTSYITVTPVNACGTGGIRSMAITKANPATPGLISGPKAICPYTAPGGTVATYSVAQQPSVTGYSWTVPAGAIGLTGQGTNTISFIYPADYTGGNISVVASNGCGSSPARSLAVSRLNPSTPSVIDVINTVSCPYREYTYTLSSMPSNATSVQWTIPSSGMIISGQGSSSIRVAYPQSSVVGNVTATAVSNCGTSATRSTAVKLPACPPSFAGGADNENAKGLSMDISPASSFHAEVFPNPSVDEFNIRVSGKENNLPVNVRVLDLQGRMLLQFRIMPDAVMKFGRSLLPGTYIVEIVQGSGRSVHKLIKQ